ncbi:MULTISPECIES: PEP-CTERM sorting domain-containing protein [unclassified Lentimonas]|uniref:PEP-CTERM sorting domain-containing protein n=1 Tax=unclassified Lentimonas TaxID=2630993 RepID=UPI001323E3C6|nr:MULTISPECIES: PEP-CTERM sorting domain-containing protein [unclassified Lentimonas]CAA6680236.1 Unannotated [Lentimonas sp. CC4]CAA6687385.1 Unannotated [Lentimonas sp. CC6]CAA7076748.1 Unannotated [Lentimonas sp. CC4]CAA7171849.1 Unannotated [Lentimonas sp. CC21]CAA7183582.1 Unannotated [Lentimonas sp. CC8]
MKTGSWHYLLISFVTCVSSNAAIVGNGRFDTAPSTYRQNSASVGYYLNAASGDIICGGQYPFERTFDTKININQWLITRNIQSPQYDATGGNVGGGMVMRPDDVLKNRPRAILQFAQDDKTTTGIVNFSIDFKFNHTDTGMVGNVELYGWNAGETGPILSIGGSTANSADFNVTVAGSAVNLLGETGVKIHATDFSADTWKTVTIEGVDLGTGFDFFAWRLGVVGADDGDIASFDNLVDIPEPETFTLLFGLTGLVLIFIRRRQ